MELYKPLFIPQMFEKLDLAQMDPFMYTPKFEHDNVSIHQANSTAPGPYSSSANLFTQYEFLMAPTYPSQTSSLIFPEVHSDMTSGSYGVSFTSDDAHGVANIDQNTQFYPHYQTSSSLPELDLSYQFEPFQEHPPMIINNNIQQQSSFIDNFNTFSSLESQPSILTGNPDRPFRCPMDICRVSFTRKTDLKRHFDRTHLMLKDKCEDCGKEFSRKDALMKHTKRPKACRGRTKSMTP